MDGQHRAQALRIPGLTLRDLRTRLGVSEEAFHVLTGISRSQVSLLERGKSRNPHKSTVAAYVKACDISDMTFHECLNNTIRRYEDPGLAETLALEERIAELQPRASSGQRIDRSADIFEVGEEIYESASGTNRVRWSQLAAFADELNYRRYPAGTSPKTANEGILSAALFAVERMCASQHEEEFSPLVSLWRGHAENLIAMCLQSDFRRSQIEATWVFAGVIPLARRYPVEFLRDESAFQEQWASEQLRLLTQTPMPLLATHSMAHRDDLSAEPDPVLSQLFGYAQLLAGIAEGVRGRVTVPVGHDDLVSAS